MSYPDLRRGLRISMALKLKRLSFKKVGDQIGITASAVSSVIYGRSTSAKVKAYITDTLGIAWDEPTGTEPAAPLRQADVHERYIHNAALPTIKVVVSFEGTSTRRIVVVSHDFSIQYQGRLYNAGIVPQAMPTRRVSVRQLDDMVLAHTVALNCGKPIIGAAEVRIYELPRNGGPRGGIKVAA